MIKAYYVFRRDLKMSPSKLAVQVGHGTQYLVMKAEHSFLSHWIQESDSRKIVCEIKTFDDLIKLSDFFREKGVSFESIIDSGYTEVQPLTQTGIAFFIDDENVDAVVLKRVKRLQLYKDVQHITDRVREELGLKFRRCRLSVNGKHLYGEYDPEAHVVRYSEKLWRGGYQHCYDLNLLSEQRKADPRVPSIQILEVYSQFA